MINDRPQCGDLVKYFDDGYEVHDIVGNYGLVLGEGQWREYTTLWPILWSTGQRSWEALSCIVPLHPEKKKKVLDISKIL